MRETILRRRDDRMKTVYPLSPNMNIMKRKIIDDEEEEDKSPIATQNQCGNRRMRRERERERERERGPSCVVPSPDNRRRSRISWENEERERESTRQTNRQTDRQTETDTAIR